MRPVTEIPTHHRIPRPRKIPGRLKRCEKWVNDTVKPISGILKTVGEAVAALAVIGGALYGFFSWLFG